MKESEIKQLQGFIREKLFQFRMPGLAIAVKSNDGEIYQDAFGYSDISAGKPVSADTCFSLASITKSFTSISVLKLARSGHLSLKDAVSDHIRELRGSHFDEVTIHHLLSHSSGITTFGSSERHLRRQLNIGDGMSSSVESFQSVLSHAGEWTIGKPGERFSYFNEGYMLLHDIVSLYSGTSYEQFVEENILAPLGMGNTFFVGGTAANKKGKIAVPYSMISGNFPTHTKVVYGTPGSGNLFSNVEDMSKYLEMLVHKGTINGEEIVNSSDIEAMETLQVRNDVFEVGPDGVKKDPGTGYGYGLFINENFLGKKLISHTGSILVYTSFMGYVRETGSYVIALANTTGYPMVNIGKYALAASMNTDPEQLNFIRNQKITEGIEGTYSSYGGTIGFYVQKKGDCIEVKSRFAQDSIIMIPEMLSDQYARFSSVQQGSLKLYADFVTSPDGGKEMIYQNSRYKRA